MKASCCSSPAESVSSVFIGEICVKIAFLEQPAANASRDLPAPIPIRQAGAARTTKG